MGSQPAPLCALREYVAPAIARHECSSCNVETSLLVSLQLYATAAAVAACIAFLFVLSRLTIARGVDVVCRVRGYCDFLGRNRERYHGC